MRILLTNDDGIREPGIAALYRALADFGEVAVVAPAMVQTGMSHAVSVGRSIAARRLRVGDSFEGWAVDGSPADCVKLAMMKLLDWRPDFVLSGINAGINTGLYVLYSGTVAAALEGAAFFGVPSMAVSLELSDRPDFEGAGKIARQVFDRYVTAGPPQGSCTNVNIPALDAGRPEGVRVCPQSLIPAEAAYSRQTDANGARTFRLEPGAPGGSGVPGTDTDAVRNRHVAITPLKFDATDHALLSAVSQWGWPETFA